MRLRDWQPEFPAGDLRAIWLHWTGGDYTTVFDAYHFCVRGDGGDPLVVPTHDLRANMRDVRNGPDVPYAAHTAGRNSWAVGLAICAMDGAEPGAFGRYPLLPTHVDALCAVAARVARAYGIALTAIRTHAEAAVDDGYFGCGTEQRWDIARLVPSAAPLATHEAAAVGDALRARIAAV